MVGCATGRGILSVQVQMPDNPTSVQSVRIDEVIDKRVYEMHPSKPSIPSLMNEEDYAIDEIRSRAIARKRGGYGNALGDIVLPEGDSVRNLVRNIITRAFREAGVSVLKSGEAGAANAVPVKIEINQFWGWITPKFTHATIEFISNVKVTGNIPGFVGGKEIKGHSAISSMSPSTRVWVAAVNMLIDDMVQKAKK